MAIWSKGGDDTNALVHAFTVGDDYTFDRVIARYDILGCIAHATMLGEVGLMPAADAASLVAELQRLHQEYLDGAWTVELADEDVHSKIEALLTERVGEAGKRLHTGRSRNDQVLTAVRLWQKDRLIDAASAVLDTAGALLERAQRYEFMPLPGYTHLQRGMPSSCGMFFAGHAQALLDNLGLFQAAYTLADRCPLGSGASYGVGLPLDRQRTSSMLGFERTPGVAMADANSRGKAECASLDAIGAVVSDLSRLAADLVFFTTAECGFFRIGGGFTTGSSIMPQKKNLDLFELLRGRSARFLGLRTGLYATTLGLHSGYSRDLQDTKALLIQGMDLGLQGLAVVAEAAPSLEPVRERIEAALTKDIYATDEAYRLVREQGMSFRDAYVQVGNNLDQVAVPDHDATVREREHLGSTGNLGLATMLAELEAGRSQWSTTRSRLHGCWQALLA
ncbi:MAG: argininosuccinate lyase [Planctomycetota bacterium]|jgi:argininosuccinate lyase|nr:argininosuccinate lyase [Planctomycetota bacterium]